MKKTLFAALILATSFNAHAASVTTDDVWQHHIDAWKARDVPEIMADYDDNSVVIVMHRLFKGRKQIADLFTHLFEVFDGAEQHVVDTPSIQGHVVYITWHAQKGGVAYPLGTDTFVIENGRITYQTVAADPNLLALPTD